MSSPLAPEADERQHYCHALRVYWEDTDTSVLRVWTR